MEGKSAEKLLRILEEGINKLPKGDPQRKSLAHMMIPYKLKARRWFGKSPSIPIEINEVHRNEQINITSF